MDRTRTAFAAFKNSLLPCFRNHSKKKEKWSQRMADGTIKKTRSTETRQIQLYTGPMAERRSIPRVSIGPVLTEAGSRDLGVSGDGGRPPDKPLWLRHWDASCTQRLLATHIGEASRPGPNGKQRKPIGKIFSPKRSHTPSHLHTTPSPPPPSGDLRAPHISRVLRSLASRQHFTTKPPATDMSTCTTTPPRATTYVRAGALVPPPPCLGPGQHPRYTRANFGQEAETRQPTSPTIR